MLSSFLLLLSSFLPFFFFFFFLVPTQIAPTTCRKLPAISRQPCVPHVSLPLNSGTWVHVLSGSPCLPCPLRAEFLFSPNCAMIRTFLLPPFTHVFFLSSLYDLFLLNGSSPQVRCLPRSRLHVNEPFHVSLKVLEVPDEQNTPAPEEPSLCAFPTFLLSAAAAVSLLSVLNLPSRFSSQEFLFLLNSSFRL